MYLKVKDFPQFLTVNVISAIIVFNFTQKGLMKDMAGHDTVAAYLDVPNLFTEVIHHHSVVDEIVHVIEQKLVNLSYNSLLTEKIAFVKRPSHGMFDYVVPLLEQNKWSIVLGKKEKDIDCQMIMQVVQDWVEGRFTICIIVSSDVDFVDLERFLVNNNVSVYVLVQYPDMKKDGSLASSGAELRFLPHMCESCAGAGFTDGNPSQICGVCLGAGMDA